MNRTTRRILRAGAALLLLVAALLAEMIASRRPQANMLELATMFQDGFYGLEHTSTLPGPYGAASRTFRWAKPESSFMLWPPLGDSGVLELEYLNPAATGYVQVRIGQHIPSGVPPADKLRILRLLLPPIDATIVQLTQAAPIASGDRQLGVLVSATRWWAIEPDISAGSFPVRWELLRGLPLTLALLAGLGLLVRLPYRWSFGLTLLVLAGTVVLAVRQPWDSRAMQPALQGLIGYAMLGAALFYAGRRIRVQNWAMLMLIVWGLSTLLFFGPIISHDGSEYYAYVRSLFVDGDLRFDNELDPAQSPFPGTPDFASIPTSTGYTPNLASVGPALAWTPFWLVAHAVTRLGQAIGLDWRADGYAPPYIVLVALGSALAGLATMGGCFTIARRWFAAPVAALAAITIYFGSNLLYYAQFQGSFAHSLSGATATWLVVATLALDEAPTRRRWLGLGVATGAMVVTYWITALLLVTPLLVVLRHTWRRARRRDWCGLLELGFGACMAAGAALIVFAPQMLAWRIIEGGWLATPHGGDFLTPRNIKLQSVLLSPLYGLAWWTPAYFTGLIGSIWFAVRRPWPGLALLAGIALYLTYNASLSDWSGGGAFGLRRFTALAPWLAVGLAVIFGAVSRHPALQWALAGALIGWSVQMTARYVTYALPHDPRALSELGLRGLLLTPEPVPLRSFVAVAREGWIGRLVRAPNLGDALILMACLLIVWAMLLGWRSHRRPVADDSAIGSLSA